MTQVADRGYSDALTSSPVIDVHAHLFVPDLEEMSADMPGRAEVNERTASWIGAETRAQSAIRHDALMYELVDLDRRLEVMDMMGVDVQAVSLAPVQYCHWADAPNADTLVETANAAIAAYVAQCPSRLIGIAEVSLSHPYRAAVQLQRAVTEYDMRGVQISSRAGHEELSAPDLDPFWEVAASLGVPIFIHPLGSSLGERLAQRFLHNTVGQPVEHAIALSHIVFSGVLDRHPDLRLCAAHGGGYLPYYLGRSDHAWETRPESRGCVDPPSKYFPMLYFDSLVYRGDSLRTLLDLVSADHVAMGTDYPYDMGVRDPLNRLDATPGLTPRERKAIASDTARQLLGMR